MRTRQILATASAVGVMTAAMSGVAAPAQAAPLFTGGLVNVTVTDVDVDALNNNQTRILNNVLNDNEVNLGVVAQVAATVCDVNVGGILGELRDTGTAACEAGGGTIEFAQRS